MEDTIRDDFSRQLAFLEAYDKTYGIFDHDLKGSSDPLAIIGHHPAEDVVTYSRTELLLTEILATRLPELTNTSLMELLELPRWFLDKLLEKGRINRKKEEAATEKLFNNQGS